MTFVPHTWGRNRKNRELDKERKRDEKRKGDIEREIKEKDEMNIEKKELNGMMQ